MSNLISLTQFDIAPYAKTKLAADARVGDDSLSVVSVEGIKAGDFIVVGVLSAATAELHTVKSVTPPANPTTAGVIALNDTLRYTHLAVSDQVQRTLFDQFKIYSGTAQDISTHTLLTTVDISWVTLSTPYMDEAGDSTTLYSYSYFNSGSNAESEHQAVLSEGVMGVPLDVTPRYLREVLLYGLDLTDDNGNPLPDAIYWHGILAAYHWMEQLLGIDIIQRSRTDRLDFQQQEYRNFVFTPLWHYPVQSVQAVSGVYFGATVPFPLEWVQLKARMGLLNLVPTGSSFSSFLIPAGAGIIPVLVNGVAVIPNFWEVKYTTGFASGTLPYNLRDMIAKRAAFAPLNILGDLVGGIAIASKSLGIDGLSQSINTTNSAENAGYSGRLRQYEREMKIDIPILKSYWSRRVMGVV